MAQVYKNGRILQKVDTEENWFANDPEILKGEICVSTFDDGKVKIKIAGEHGKKWSQIDYLETDSSLVHYDTYNELPEVANNGSIAIIDSETRIPEGEEDEKVYKSGSAFIYNAELEEWEGISSYETLEESLLVEKVNVLEAKVNNIVNPIQLKGRVDTVEDLPTTGVEIGWAYLVGAEGSENFEEYVCTALSGTPETPTWESLGKVSEQADWNENNENSPAYVNHRTHWEEESELTLVELENVQGNYTYFDFAEPIVAGETYTMIASGFSPDALNTTETVIAESPLGSTDVQIYNSNGLSFIQREVPPSQAEGKHGQFNGPTGGNVTLIKQTSVVHQLDPKYVPITDFVYVDKTNGDDENEGSYNSPVKTLAKGIELSNIEPRKYIKFKDTGEIHIETPSSDYEYKFVENVDFRLITDSSQTICFDRGFYNIKKEFKVRGAGNFTNVDENNANYPLAYNKSNIDIDVTGDVTFDGYWFTKFDNVADLDSIISIKCKTFNSNFHFSYSVTPETNSYLLNNVWPSISIDADKVISRQTGAPLYKVKIKANKFEVAEKENTYFAPIQAYYLDLDIKEFYVPDCAWSGSDVTYKINLFKLEANYNSAYCQTNNIHSYLDLPMSKMKIGKLSLPKLTKSGSLNEQKFCMFNFESSTTYSDYVIAPYLDLQIDTLDLTRTFSGNVHYGLYDIYANGSVITGNCNSILLPESSAPAQKMIYPWDFQWYRPINYNASKDPVDNFRWNFQTSPVDIYVDFGAPASGNDGRSKEHPISSMSELKKAFDLATAGIKIHVMSGGSDGIYAGNATRLGLDFSTITPTTVMKPISIVGEFSNSEITIYGLKAQASLEIYNFKDVRLSNCYFPTNTLDNSMDIMGIVNIHNVVQLYVDNCKFHSLSTIKCCKFYDNGGNDYASSFSLNADEIQNIAIAGGASGNNVMPGTVKINCNGDINSMSINKIGGKVDVFANGYINITNNASSQVELNITGTNNIKFTHKGESSNLKLKVESTSNTLDIISYSETSYSDSNIIRNSEILFKGKDVETDYDNAGLPLWFYSSYVSINAEKNFYDRGNSQYYTKLFIDGQTRLKIDADWIEWNPDYTGSTSMSSGLYTSQYQYLELNAHRVNFDWKNATYQQLIINADEVVFNNFGGSHYCHEFIWNIGTLTVNHATESCGWFELMDYNVNTTFCAEHLLTRNDLPISKINVDHIINNRQSYGNPSQPLFYVNMMASYTHPTRKYPDDSAYYVFLGCRLHLNVGVYEMPKLSYYGPASSSYKKLVGTSGAPGCEVSGGCQHVSIGGMQNETAKQWMWDLQGLDLTNYTGSAASKYNDQNSFNFYYAEYTNWCNYYIDFMIGSDANSGHDEQHPMKTFAGLIQKYNWNNSSNSLPMMRLHIGTPTTSYVLSEASSSSSRLILDFTNVYTQCIEIVGNPNMSECVIQGLSNSSICYIHDFKHLYLDSCTFTGSSKISAVNNLYLYNCTLAGNISVESNQLNNWGGVSSNNWYEDHTVTYQKATAVNGFVRINAGGNGAYLGLKPWDTLGNSVQLTLNFDGYVSDLRMYNFNNSGRYSIKAQEIQNFHDYAIKGCYLTVETTAGSINYNQHKADTSGTSDYQIQYGNKHIISASSISWNCQDGDNFYIFNQYLRFDCKGYLSYNGNFTIYNSNLAINAGEGINLNPGLKLSSEYDSNTFYYKAFTEGTYSGPAITGTSSKYVYADIHAGSYNCSNPSCSYTIFNIVSKGDTTIGASHSYNTYNIEATGYVYMTSGSWYTQNYNIFAKRDVYLGGGQTCNTGKIVSDGSIYLQNGGFSGCTFYSVVAAQQFTLGGGWNLYSNNGTYVGNYVNVDCDIFSTNNPGTSGADQFHINCRKWSNGSNSLSFKTWTPYPSLQSRFVVTADELETSSYPIVSLNLPKAWGNEEPLPSLLKEFRLKFNKINYTGSESSNPFVWAYGSVMSGSGSGGQSGMIDCALEFDFGTTQQSIDLARCLGTYLLSEGLQYKINPEFFSTEVQKNVVYSCGLSVYSGTTSNNIPYYSLNGPYSIDASKLTLGQSYYIRVGGFEFGPVNLVETKGGTYMLGDINFYYASNSLYYIPKDNPGIEGAGAYFSTLTSTGYLYIKQSLFENPYYHTESLGGVPQISLDTSGNTIYTVEIYSKKEVVQKVPTKYLSLPDYSENDETSNSFIKGRPMWSEKGLAVIGFTDVELDQAWNNYYAYYPKTYELQHISVGSKYRIVFDGKDYGIYTAYPVSNGIAIGSAGPNQGIHPYELPVGVLYNNSYCYVFVGDGTTEFMEEVAKKPHSFTLYYVNENMPDDYNYVYSTLDTNLVGIDGNKVSPKEIYVWNGDYNNIPSYVSDANQGTDKNQPLLTFGRACQLLQYYGDDCFIHIVGDNNTLNLDTLYSTYRICFETYPIRVYLEKNQKLKSTNAFYCTKDFVVRGEGDVLLSSTSNGFLLVYGSKLDIQVTGDVTFTPKMLSQISFSSQRSDQMDKFMVYSYGSNLYPTGTEEVILKCNNLQFGVTCDNGISTATTSQTFGVNVESTTPYSIENILTELDNYTNYNYLGYTSGYDLTYSGDFTTLLSTLENGKTYTYKVGTATSIQQYNSSTQKIGSNLTISQSTIVVRISTSAFSSNLPLQILGDPIEATKLQYTYGDLTYLIGKDFDINGVTYKLKSAEYQHWNDRSYIMWTPYYESSSNYTVSTDTFRYSNMLLSYDIECKNFVDITNNGNPLSPLSSGTQLLAAEFKLKTNTYVNGHPTQASIMQSNYFDIQIDSLDISGGYYPLFALTLYKHRQWDINVPIPDYAKKPSVAKINKLTYSADYQQMHYYPLLRVGSVGGYAYPIFTADSTDSQVWDIDINCIEFTNAVTQNSISNHYLPAPYHPCGTDVTNSLTIGTVHKFINSFGLTDNWYKVSDTNIDSVQWTDYILQQAGSVTVISNSDIDDVLNTI